MTTTPIPRPEHPRPNAERDHWLNLNGSWRFAFDPQNIGEQERWYKANPTRTMGAVQGLQTQDKPLTITVPYPWESRLSGQAAPDYKGAAWYEREFTIPTDWEGLIPYLNFEAVDWHARVWINGQFAAEHDNGYLPFSVDLSPFAQPGETVTVTVRAFDIADSATLLGKQVPRWYTRSSGIWQTVWLEGRAPSHISATRIEPDLDNEHVIIKLKLNIAATSGYMVRVRSKNDEFPLLETYRDFIVGRRETSLILRIPQPKLWSPESPHLYELDIELGRAAGGPVDRVSTYFGMRSIERGPWNGNQFEVILLNGEPVYLRGALDQAFHPDGLHSYPTDDVIRGDIQLAKDFGLNMLRCHIKINDPRYYYWADRLGLLIMYDFPSPDIDTPSMRRLFTETLPRVLARDFNSPSIFAWVLFNETWGLTEHHTPDGQRWLREITDLARQLDPTRLIEDNSVCRYDHVDTDINSWHFYINDYQRVRQHIQRVVDETYPGSPFNYVGGEYVQQTAPLMNSEYGGIAARMGDQDIAWCFKYQTTELRRHPKICGYVYTELSDIEWEHNGLVNYDRSLKEFGYDFFVPEMSPADLNAADLVGLDAPPCQTLAPGSQFSAPVFVSHWGPAMSAGQVRWQLDFIDRFGDRATHQSGELPLQPTRFGVTAAGDLTLTLPDENGLAIVALWLVDEAGEIRCRNYVSVEVRGEVAPATERLDSGVVLRFAPGAFVRSSWSWPVPFVDGQGRKFAAQGSGWVEYELSPPAELNLKAVQRLRLRFEAGARAGNAKVDWPQRLNGFNYPQTEAKKFPTDLTVTLNGVSLGSVRLPDDPADARGTLSHHRGIDPGAYGYLTELILDGEALAALRESMVAEAPLQLRFDVSKAAEYRGGFSLYGDRLGCYPLAPSLFFDVED